MTNILESFKFVPLNQAPDILFKAMGWDNKADFMTELQLDDTDTSKYTVPLCRDELTFVDLQEIDNIWNNLTNDTEKQTLYICGTPSRAYPMSVHEFTKEIS